MVEVETAQTSMYQNIQNNFFNQNENDLYNPPNSHNSENNNTIIENNIEQNEIGNLDFNKDSGNLYSMLMKSSIKSINTTPPDFSISDDEEDDEEESEERY